MKEAIAERVIPISLPDDEHQKSIEYMGYLNRHLENARYSIVFLSKLISTQEFIDAYENFANRSKVYRFDSCRPELLLLSAENHGVSSYSKIEFDAYRKKFYPTDAEKELNKYDEYKCIVEKNFNIAYRHHYALNDYCLEYWKIYEYYDSLTYIPELKLGDPIPIPLISVLHMICDWNAWIADHEHLIHLGKLYPDKILKYWVESSKVLHINKKEMSPETVKLVDFIITTLAFINAKERSKRLPRKINLCSVYGVSGKIFNTFPPLDILQDNRMQLIKNEIIHQSVELIQKWTADHYLKIEKTLMENFKKNHPSDDPVSLFKSDEASDEYIFNEENWNGNDLLRRFMFKIYRDGKISKTVKEFSISADCCYDNDDWRGYILIEPKTSPFDLYTISWYKSRGRTDGIFKNGEPITLQDYVMLLNIFEIPVVQEEGDI